MTLTFIGEKFPRPTSKSLQDGTTGTRKFHFRSDTANELEGNVYSAADAQGAFLGSIFPGSLTAQCFDQKAIQDESSQIDWYVTCEYKSILNQIEQERITNPNPLNRATRIAWTSRTVIEAKTRLLRAKTGAGKYAYQTFDTAYTFELNSISNAATDPFDPTIEVPVTQWIASCSKNVTVPPTWILTYDNAVNSDEFVLDGLTVPKGCGKLEGLRLSEKMKENGTEFRQLQFNVILKTYREKRAGETDAPEPWDVEVLNEGMRKPNATSKWENIKDVTGQSVSKPVPLNEFGSPLDPSGASIPETSLYWCLFRPFNRKTFTGTLPLV